MKRFFILLLLCSATLPSLKAQKVYHAALARWDAALNTGLGYAASDNLNANLAWNESYIMMSYITMYRHTGAKVWLDKLFEHTAMVLQQRDDNVPRNNYQGQATPSWSCSLYSNNGANYGWLVHSGMITYPMADLVQEVFNDASIQGFIVPAATPLYGGLSYLDAADQIRTAVTATIDHHAFQWDAGLLDYSDHVSNNVYPWWNPAGSNFACGAYRFPDNVQVDPVIGEDLVDKIVPLNMQNAMGRTLISMWKINQDPNLFNQVVRLANSLRTVLWNDGFSSNVFSYWGYNGFEGDDVGHAAITFDFARLCFEEGIVFTAADMTRFASTIKNRVYVDPHTFKGFIDGSSNGWYPDNSGASSMGTFAFFAQFDRDLYHIIGEVWNQQALYSPSSTSGILWTFMANMATYNHLFTPAVYESSPGSNSAWADVDGGDVDGDGKEEIVSVRNYDGKIFIHGFSDNPGYHSADLIEEDWLQNHGTSPAWAGVAVGDFNNFPAKAEFAAASNQTGEIYLYQDNGASFGQYASTFGFPSNSQWAGLASGNFDGVPGDELVGVRNLDGDFFMWSSFSNVISLMATYTGFGSSSDWADIAAGDFDGDGKDEFVAIRNYDGGIEMLEYDPVTESIVGKADYYGNGSGSNYTAITAGDFDQDGKDEFILHRNYDGDFYIYGLDANGQIASEGTERFPVNQELGVLGTVNIGSPCCEELVSMRNFDGDIYVYSVSLGGCEMNYVCEQSSDERPRKMGEQDVVELTLFPNPASTEARLEMTLDVATDVRVELYDLRGQKVRELQNGRLGAGVQSIRIDRNDLSAGMYLVNIQLGSKTVTKKLIWQ